ncbi:tetratricopeptide repeat protein, partial [Lichenihabitans sp. Uapishka_5]
MADIFREVDEEVRQDRVQRWLARYWGWLLLAGLLIIAGVGGWRAYDYWRTQQEQAAGGSYLDALKLARDGKSAEALQRLDGLATSGTPGYRQLARLRGAAERGLTDAAAGAKQFLSLIHI